MQAASPSNTWEPVSCKVLDVKHEYDGVATLVIGGGNLPEMTPGQFNMLFIHGKGEVPISVSRIEHDSLSFTVRAVGNISSALYEIRPGEHIGLRGPFGRAWPHDALESSEPRDIILLAGGIGMAPLRPSLLRIAEKRSKYNRAALLVGARAPGNLLFDDEIAQVCADADIQYLATVDSAPQDWSGNVGVITTLLSQVDCDFGNAAVLTCGPEVMFRNAAVDLIEQGVAAGSIYVSMERNMKCAVRLCGHCMYGGSFVCKDGPVFAYSDVAHLLNVREF